MKDCPRDSRRPTPTAKHLVPIPFHKTIYLVERSPVARYPIVGVVATKDLIEPKDLVLEGPVPNVTHQRREVGHTAAKPRLLRFATHLVVAFALSLIHISEPTRRTPIS